MHLGGSDYAVYLSGQTALDSEGVMAGEAADDQTRHALGNMGRLLVAVNEVYSGYFNKPYPARSPCG